MSNLLEIMYGGTKSIEATIETWVNIAYRKGQEDMKRRAVDQCDAATSPYAKARVLSLEIKSAAQQYMHPTGAPSATPDNKEP